MLLVTGATGHTGTHVIQKLKTINYQDPIRCTIREQSDTSVLAHSGLDIELCRGVLEDYHFVNSCMKGVREVVHIAGIHWSENVTKAALANGVERVIFVHTTGRFSKFKSAAKDYIRIEEATLRSGLPYTILRPTMIYGSTRDKNISRLIDYIDRHVFFPILGDGQNLVQPILSRDLAEAVVAVLLNKEKTAEKAYDLAGKFPIRYEQLVRTISAGLGRKTVFVRVPYVVALLGAWAYNVLVPNARISVEQVMRMNEDRSFDYENAAVDFGFNPTSFEDGVAEQVKEYLRIKSSPGYTASLCGQ